MNGGTAADTDDSLYANWLPSGVWQGLLSGKYVGVLYEQGSNGYYWSSTAAGTDDSFYLHFDGGSVAPIRASGKGVGYAVRCLI